MLTKMSEFKYILAICKKTPVGEELITNDCYKLLKS